ncbi:hypothetical protein SLS61_004528 [Didymella pomorum]
MVKIAVAGGTGMEELSGLLRGYDVVLSFIAPYLDQSEAALAQKNLIDASIQVGVERFAPSEWASARFEYLPWYSYKAETRQYLEKINKDSKVLDYCLFQPGLFTNYLAQPYRTSNHLDAIETPFDFDNRRMIVCAGGDDQKVTMTTVTDFANVVAMAVEYPGDWPVVGGMKGSDLSLRDLLTLGEQLRAGLLSAIDAGAFQSNDAWNVLLPDYKFEDAESFLSKVWCGKP